MPSYLHYWRPDEVVDAASFTAFCQQQIGTPPARGNEFKRLLGQLKTFWADNPQADWQTLVRTVVWAKAKRKRLMTCCTILKLVRAAYADGFLPELDPRQQEDEDLEKRISAALAFETDPYWRRRLNLAVGVEARRYVYQVWRQHNRSRDLVG
jgi:hypothetical protein